MGNHYRVFGDLTVVDEKGREHPIAGRNGSVLALLLAVSPEPVSSGRLIEEVWGDAPPKSPETTLHSAISRLRNVVGPELTTTAGGYRLNPGSVDSTEFEAAARNARAAGTLSAYERAETEWAGEPFLGFEDVPSVMLAAERLRQLRGRLTVERLQLLLNEGGAGEAAAQLAPLVAADLFNEEHLGMYMLALNAAGRKPEALRAFRTYEEQLAEETGLEPSAKLRELELGILTDHLEPLPARPQPLVPLELRITYPSLAGERTLAVGRAGSGPPLLVHPGWMSRLDMLATGHDMRAPFWAELSKRHELVLFDRAGTGLSRDAPVDPSLEFGATELAAVLANTFDEPVPVLAASAAGPIAVRAAIDRPESISHLILQGTYASGPRTFPNEVANSLVALVRASWGMGSQVLANLLFPTTSTELRDAWARAQREFADAETAALLLQQMYDADVEQNLPELDLPCLVIHYRQDKAVPIWGGEQLAREIPGAQFVPLEGRSHYPPPGEEATVADIVDDFLGLQGS